MYIDIAERTSATGCQTWVGWGKTEPFSSKLHQHLKTVGDMSKGTIILMTDSHFRLDQHR